MADHPFDDIVRGARTEIAKGHWICQKFSCAGCGRRLTIDVPNVMHTHGTCDSCGTLTDIRARGCNYTLLIAGTSPLEMLVEIGVVACRPPKPGALTILETNAARIQDAPGSKQ